jgi:uncharacterized membrane protein YccC
MTRPKLLYRIMKFGYGMTLGLILMGLLLVFAPVVDPGYGEQTPMYGFIVFVTGVAFCFVFFLMLKEYQWTHLDAPFHVFRGFRDLGKDWGKE